MGKEKQNLSNFALPVDITDNIIEWLPTNFWTDPTQKVCYLSIVDGYVIDRMIDKFNEGLKDIIIDDTERMNHILDNMIYGISSTESNTRRVKWLSKIKNIYTRNILEEDISDMPNFDFVVQNPPYSGSLHLDFLKKGYEMLSDKGQMIIIEPSTWLINVRKYGKRGEEMRVNSSAIKKYDELKKTLKGKVKKIIIEDYNKEFNVGLYTPFSITYVDKLYNSDIIDCKICGEQKILNSLYDCNLVGNYNLIWSILNKASTYDKIKNHIYKPNKSEKIENNYYIRFAGIVGCGGCIMNDPNNGFNYNSDALYSIENKNICWQYTGVLFGNKFNSISPDVHFRIKRGSVKGTLTDDTAECITGTKEELENWKYFVFNNTLPLFINIVMTIDQNNNSLDYVPWLVDKKYTDQEIYDMFNFTDEEIKLIETTIKKYERNSPWFKRYMCGPSEVTDEEVQKFIKDLNNVKG